MTTSAIDPVTQQVIGHALRSICGEMGHTMIRTANSSVFVEGRDFSCGIVDARAELVAAGIFDPSHLSAMPLTVEYAMLHFGPGTIAEGDVFLVNDPFRGGGHLPDITLIRPVFAEGRLLAFAVNRAHHIDVGGMAVAGFPGTARSMFQEGIRIPPVRWYERGREMADVMELIALNVRFPRDQVGDFRAQLASTAVAERRILGLAAKYGTEALRAAMEATKDHSEALMRAILRELPDGTWTFDEFWDDDGVEDRPYRIHVALTIAGDAVTVDYTGTSPQAKGPINSAYSNTLSATFGALLQLVGPDVPFNHGCFRPVSVIAPRGSLLNPVPPAPCFGGVTEGSIRLIDVILGTLAPIAPDRVGAGSYGTCVNFAGGGFDPERGQDFGFYFFVEGGWGACAWRDGWNCTPNPTSNFNDYPVEWVEATLPLRYLEARLNTDSGGAGKFRGGVGTVRSFELLADEVEINGLGERMLIPPFGLAGGEPGACNALLVRRANDAAWRDMRAAYGAASPSKFNGHKAGMGDRFSIATGGGGGFGDPLERDPARVVADVREGFVSAGAARDVYGVALAADPPGFDAGATAALRDRLRAGRAGRERAYDRVVREALARAVSGEPDTRTRTEVERAERLIAAVRGESAPPAAASLEDPFDNARALAYWDAYSLERWLARRGRKRSA
jgi:N-methylhydantoinase B/oxoprolinase/acetone carboxylase alpha subunit